MSDYLTEYQARHGLCGARNAANSTFVPCMRELVHLGDHWSTSGCAGGSASWPAGSDSAIRDAVYEGDDE